jgi:peptidoglycan hydrolase-like protein with peptidoglycan-binding domain
VPTSLRSRVPFAAFFAAVSAFLLVAPTPSQAALGDRTLAQGARGADVKALQVLLRRAGFPARADGVFGRGTYRTVRRLERELGLRVDGRITRTDVRRVRLALRPASGSGGFGMESADDARAKVRATQAQEVPGEKAQLTADGLAIAPASAPQVVKDVIAAANEIAKTPYRYGGGHARWKDTGYDCSGSVSYALRGGGLLKSAMPSGSFVRWGDAGPGEWITIYAHGGHMYMEVAGLRFDTSGRAQTGSRWQKASRSPAGFTVRHPAGL